MKLKTTWLQPMEVLIHGLIQNIEATINILKNILNLDCGEEISDIIN